MGCAPFWVGGDVDSSPFNDDGSDVPLGEGVVRIRMEARSGWPQDNAAAPIWKHLICLECGHAFCPFSNLFGGLLGVHFAFRPAWSLSRPGQPFLP